MYIHVHVVALFLSAVSMLYCTNLGVQRHFQRKQRECVLISYNKSKKKMEYELDRTRLRTSGSELTGTRPTCVAGYM